MKTLKDISEIIAGFTFRTALKPSHEGNTKVLQAKNITEDAVANDDNLAKIVMDRAKTSAYVEKNDVLLTSRGVFRSAVFESNEANVIASSSLYVLRLKDDTILPDYLSIYLNSRKGQLAIQRLTSGGSIKTIPRRNIEDLQIPAPSLKKQQQIININSNWIERSKLLEQKINLSKNVAEGAINYLLTIS